MRSNHIHPLHPTGAAVLSACTEFPTFSAALGKVAQVALPAIEKAVWDAYVADTGCKPAFLKDEGLHSNNEKRGTPDLNFLCHSPSVHDSTITFPDKQHPSVIARNPLLCSSTPTVDVVVCLPSFSWDLERRVTLPPSSSTFLHSLIRKFESVCETTQNDCSTPQNHRDSPDPSTLLDPLLSVFRRLASLCADVSVSVQLFALTCEGPKARSTDVHRHSSSTKQPNDNPPLFTYGKQWRSGQEVEDAIELGGRLPVHEVKVDASASSSVVIYLVSRCQVCGLFDHLPIRQTAFRALSPRLCSGVSPAWALKSASAQRTRREEQRHLFAVLFQTAVCAVLAPLYVSTRLHLYRSHNSKGENKSTALFAVQLVGKPPQAPLPLPSTHAEHPSSPVGCPDSHQGSLANVLRSTRARMTSAHTDNAVFAQKSLCGTIGGLHCDAYGVWSGYLLVQQGHQGRKKNSADQLSAISSLAKVEPPRRETCGEATAKRLCNVFGIDPLSLEQSVSPSRKKSKRPTAAGTDYFDRSSSALPERNARSSCFTEVVVRHGEFAVLFCTTPRLNAWQETTDGDALPAASAAPALCLSSYFNLSSNLCDGSTGEVCQRARTCLIVVCEHSTRISGVAVATPTSTPHPSLPLYRVLAAEHWAYDVVAAQTRSHRCTPASSFLTAAPVFIFVDAVYVPEHLYESRQQQQQQRQRQQRQGHQGREEEIGVQTFAYLYAEALNRLCSEPPSTAAHESTAAAPSCDLRSASQLESVVLSGEMQADPGHGEATLSPPGPLENINDAGKLKRTDPVTVRSGASGFVPEGSSGEVGLRLQYVFQRVLEAAAAPGTQAYVPPPRQGSANEGVQGKNLTSGIAPAPSALHRVRLTPTALYMNATGCGGRTNHLVTPTLTANISPRAGGGGATLASGALPRRTPVSLHPKLHEVMKEEEAQEKYATGIRTEQSVVSSIAGAASPSSAGGTSIESRERMRRMRHLLDTGRGSVLRQLPRACNPPLSWTPGNETESNQGSTSSTCVSSPMEQCSANKRAVLQWARKFLLLVVRPHVEAEQRTGSKKRWRDWEDDAESAAKVHRNDDGYLHSSDHALCFTDTLPPPSQPCPHALRWWVLDQHAVHERARLEFFLTFADTYVLHPELQHQELQQQRQQRQSMLNGLTLAKGLKEKRISGMPAMTAFGTHAQAALERRRCHTALLQKLEDIYSNKHTVHPCTCDRSLPQDACLSFPVVIPPQWRQRVSMVESHLRQWGWRFAHDRNHRTCQPSPPSPPSTPSLLPASVVSWPHLSVEGFDHRITSLQALIETVEELEAVGGGASSSCVTASPPLVIPAVFLRFFISRSCRGAIMFGDAVAPAAARHMVAALACVEQYYVCSHGRPSFAFLSPFRLD